VCVCVCQSQNAAFGAQSVMHTKSKLSNSTDYAMISIRISLSRSLARAVSLSRARTLSFARALSRARSLARALSLSLVKCTPHTPACHPGGQGYLVVDARPMLAFSLRTTSPHRGPALLTHKWLFTMEKERVSCARFFPLISAQPLMLAGPFLFSKSGVLNKKRSLAPLSITSGVRLN
jgi:hypothetical protein